ncbi:hypothetical protein BHM03_00038586 [Ensete ventricosum]|nr:hypothetical protein BHM03_00038586 [Ensete ventricosum]
MESQQEATQRGKKKTLAIGGYVDTGGDVGNHDNMVGRGTRGQQRGDVGEEGKATAPVEGDGAIGGWQRWGGGSSGNNDDYGRGDGTSETLQLQLAGDGKKVAGQRLWQGRKRGGRR